MAEHHRDHGEGPARQDRRGHDGLQEGADRDQRRHGSRHRLAAQEGHFQGRQEGRPRRRRRPGGRRLGAGTGALVEVNAETDFVARNESSRPSSKAVAKLALKEGGESRRKAAAPTPTAAAMCSRR